VKLLLLIGVLGLVLLLPFYKMRACWAVGLWRKLRLVVIAYCVVVLVAAVVRLVFNFDAIYG
jgi:hypothetical protein